MDQNYATHCASVMVNAPVHQVYALFTHFNDFPKFMKFVKEVTYYDEQRSHWAADLLGHHEWDAINEDWVPDRQIGWRSTNGLDNFGKVTFESTSSSQTKIDVTINYKPPAGFIGAIGENLGGGSRFEKALEEDLNNFAHMVNEAPAGALDPQSSNYLFHEGSAAATGTTTERQNETMADEPNLSQKEPGLPILDKDITGTTNEELAEEKIDTGTIPVEVTRHDPERPDWPEKKVPPEGDIRGY